MRAWAASAAVEALFALRPSGHVPHFLHEPARRFRETNCYVDLLIELVHGLGLEPLACLGFTVASDFEGDQWTFFKPPLADLQRLYGIQIEELALFRPVLEHFEEQLRRKRVPLLEVDAYFLPDTEGSDYRTAHTKTTIGVVGAAVRERRLRYFHNAGLFELEGEDFDGVLRPAIAAQQGYLPPYCEVAKLDRVRALPPAELRAEATRSLREHLRRAPARNPLRAYAQTFPEHVRAIAQAGEGAYHAYSFAGLRQLGACFELAAMHLHWLGGGETMERAAACFERIGGGAKTLTLKLARVAHSGRTREFGPHFEPMIEDWGRGIDLLEDALAHRQRWLPAQVCREEVVGCAS